MTSSRWSCTNFNVTNGQKIYPAADLSEQMSTAGKEASGTGNMKFQMNGALTIGTVDGANIEICEEVGVENFFLFGLEAHEVAARRAAGYRPMEFLENHEELQAIFQLIRDGFFSRGNSAQFQPLVDNLMYHDPYFVLADYQSYSDCQALVDQTYRDKEGWTRMSILNSARSGKFSSDRTIREYCDEIWKAKPVPVQLIVAGRSEGGPSSVTFHGRRAPAAFFRSGRRPERPDAAIAYSIVECLVPNPGARSRPQTEAGDRNASLLEPRELVSASGFIADRCPGQGRAAGRADPKAVAVVAGARSPGISASRCATIKGLEGAQAHRRCWLGYALRRAFADYRQSASKSSRVKTIEEMVARAADADADRRRRQRRL